MKKKLFILFSIALIACGAEKENSVKEDNNQTETFKTDEKIPAWVINTWKNHFNESDIKTLSELYDEWLSVKTENDLAKLYFKSIEKGDKIALSIQAKLDKLTEDKFYAALDAFMNENDTTKPWLSGLDPTCFAECTSPGFRKNFALLYEKAKSTEGKNDDEYFKLMLDTYGESGYVTTLYSSYFTGTWDYGGGSLLGNGQHAKILKKIDAIQKQTKIFDAEIKSIREDIIRDIKEHIAYMNTTEKIVKEIEDIIKSVKLNKDEKYELEIRKSEFLKSESGIQTDCEHKNCDYGG